jgi:hypothetical protein
MNIDFGKLQERERVARAKMDEARAKVDAAAKVWQRARKAVERAVLQQEAAKTNYGLADALVAYLDPEAARIENTHGFEWLRTNFPPSNGLTYMGSYYPQTNQSQLQLWINHDWG